VPGAGDEDDTDREVSAVIWISDGMEGMLVVVVDLGNLEGSQLIFDGH
jgi:hypothetical protein